MLAPVGFIDTQRLASELREAMDSLNLTTYDVAERTRMPEITQPVIWSILCGRLPFFAGLTMLDDLSLALKLPQDYLRTECTMQDIDDGEEKAA